MMKKKNVAMAMAAVTVAAPVAQMAVASTAFAAETNTVTAAEAIAEVAKLLEDTYSDPRETGELFNGDATVNGQEYKNSVYSIHANGREIKTIGQLEKLLEKAEIENTSVVISVVNKGYRVENGNKVATELTKVRRYDAYVGEKDNKADYDNFVQSSLKAIKSNVNNEANNSNLVTNVVEYNAEGVDISLPGIVDKNIHHVAVTLVNGKTIILDKYSNKLNFSRPVDVNGNFVDLTNVVNTTAAGLNILKSVVGFENVAEYSKAVAYDIKPELVKEMVISNNSTSINEDLSAFYNGAYSAEGKELLTVLAKKEAYNNGKKYNLTDISLSDIKHKDGVYTLVIAAKVTKEGSALPTGNNLTITVKTTDQTKLNEFVADINTVMVSLDKLEGIINKAGRYTTLAGKNRFETAVEVSKAKNSNNVVLVGWDAITDGLAAAPFAKEKDASILLSKKDEVPTVVMNEIKRIISAGGDTVYIIGGTDVISEKVEAQLLKELKELNKNIKLERIAGKNRFETSVEIAKNMNLQYEKAYVVGGFGEADAMSVAPLAAKTMSPIIVSPEAGLTDSAKNLLTIETAIKDVKFIGGTNKISAQVMSDVREAADNRKSSADRAVKLKRVSGATRQDTNAEVLKLFPAYGKNDANTIYVAKDGMVNNSHLVDALTAARLERPMVLSTNKLTDSQMQAIDKLDNNDGSTNLVQVGLGVASNIMDKIVSLISNDK